MAASSLPCTGNTIFVAVLVLAVQWGGVTAVAMGETCTLVGDCDFSVGAVCGGGPPAVCGCAAGYEVNGAGTGCQLIAGYCSTLTAANDGSVSYTDNQNVGSEATFSCAAGYSTTGTTSSTCNAGGAGVGSGVWSPTPAPACTVIAGYCSTLTAASDGSVSYTDNQNVGSEATFSCAAGYSTTGTTSSTCNAGGAGVGSGVWSPTPAPACTVIAGYCSTLTAASDGSVSYTDNQNVGSEATFSCDAGYSTTGTTSSTCSAGGAGVRSGVWSPTPAPACTVIDWYCPTLTASNYNSVTYTSNRRIGSSATFTCDAGYETTVSFSYTCNAGSAGAGNGVWSGSTPPTCTAIASYCSSLTVSNHGTVAYSDGLQLGSQATFRCDTGYSPTSSTTSTCNEDRSWSVTTAPTCTAIATYCGEVPSASSNSVAGSPSSGREVGSTVLYTCLNGYKISGTSSTYSRTLTCTAWTTSNGAWSSSAPQCVPIDNYCAVRPNPIGNSNAGNPSNGQRIGSTVVYTCLNGYKIGGTTGTTQYSRTITCGAADSTSGTWSDDPPTCVAIDNYCDAVPTANQNSEADAPSNNRRVGSTVVYTCSNGYEISGSNSQYTRTLTCLTRDATSGLWSSTAPTCSPIVVYCQLTLNAPQYGSVSNTKGQQIGSIVTFQCDAGYETQDVTTSTCNANNNVFGAWSVTRIPTCTAIDHFCGTVPTVDNSIAGSPSNSGRLGATVIYTCSLGYRISGSITTTYSSYITCTTGSESLGSWSTVPVCEALAAYCLQLTDPDHGSVSYTDNRQVGSTGSFSCDSGYQAIGTTSSTCTAGAQPAGSGVWSPALTPACTPITSYCPSLTASDHGTVSYSPGLQLGSQATFRCNNGYSPTSPTTSTCNVGGSWSVAAAPTCTAIVNFCDEAPSASSNSVAGTASSGREVGSTVVYTCSNGYKISGTTATLSRTLTCAVVSTSNGAWSSSAPQCVPIDNYCAVRPNPISNSNAGNPSNGQRIGSTVVYTCSFGYKISGTTLYSRTITCGAADSTSGNWSVDPPTCVAIDNYCDAVPTANQNSEAGAPSNNRRIGSSVVYTCSTGYKIRGSSSQYTRTLTCQARDTIGGSWSSTVPTCDAIVQYCSPSLAEPQYGSVSSTNGQQIGSIVTFQCDAGYETQDTTTSTCNADSSSAGRWSVTSIPTCTAIDAGLGGTCYVPENCFPYAICAENGKCLCIDSHYDNDGADTVGGICILKVKVGVTCPRDDACSDRNAICLGSTCQCNTDYYGTPQQTCDRRRALYYNCASLPSTTDQCSDANALCRYENSPYQCRCNSGYHNPTNTAVCEPNNALGVTCLGTTADECSDPNGSCIEGVCACNVGYYDDDFSGNEGGNCKTVDELKVTDINFVVTTTSMTVSWAAPTDRGDFVHTYQVQYRPKDGSSGTVIEAEVTATQDEITGLTPGQAYSIIISSINKRTTSQARSTSVTTEMTTKPEMPGPLNDASSDFDTDGGSIHLRWQQPNIGLVYSYAVRLYGDGVDLSSTSHSTSTYFSSATLKNGFTYSVDITARSRRYNGDKQEDSETFTTTIKTVVKVPDPPTDLQCADIRDVSITLSWTAPTVPNGDIVGYKIEVFAYNGGLLNTLVHDITVTVQNITFTVPDLLPGSYYTFKVYTINEEYHSTQSAWSPSPYCATKAKLSDPPLSLAVSDVTSRGLTVAWDKPSDTFGEHLGNVAQIVTQDGTCIKEYRQICSNCVASTAVAFGDTSCSADSITSTIIAAALLTNRQTHRFTELLPDIDYTVIVRAVNTEGRGSEATQQQRTLEEAPQKPFRLAITDVTSISFKLSWLIPGPRPGNTTFSVSVQPVTGPAQSKAVTVEGFSTRSVVVTGLQEFWDYTVGITAETSVGTAVSDEQPQVTTKQAEPGPVRDFEVVQKLDNVFNLLQVQWRAPSILESNGIISHYTLVHNTTNVAISVTIGAKDDSFLYTDTVDVLPDIFYSFEVYAVNVLDQKGVSLVKVIQAPAGAPPNPIESNNIPVIRSADVSTDTKINILIREAFFYQTDNGKIRSHGLLVCRTEMCALEDDDIRDPSHFQSEDNWGKAVEHDFTLYRATSPEWLQQLDRGSSKRNISFDSELPFTIGSDTCSLASTDYCNGPLRAGTDYSVFAVVCTRSACTTSQQYGPFRTLEGETSEVQLADKNGLVIGLVVGIVCLLLVIITLSIIIWRIRRRNTKNKPEETQYQMTLQSIQIQDEGYESIDTFSLDFSSIQLLDQKLGSGQFGEVWKGKLTKQGRRQTAAIKVVKDTTNQVAVSDLKTELETLKRVGTHPNIVALLGYCEHDGVLYIAMEYVAGGDLLTFLRASRLKANNVYSNARTISSLKQDEILGFALGIARGMVHLSSKQVIHRDLAARNVLLGDNQVPKISDFGLSRTEQVYLKTTQTKLPVRWLAYESLFENSYTTKSDVWSFGVVLWEITSLGGSPFHGMKAKDITGKLLQGHRLPKPESCGQELYDLMLQCWDKDPDGRPTFEEIEQSLQYMLDDSRVYMNLTVEGTPNYANIDIEES